MMNQSEGSASAKRVEIFVDLPPELAKYSGTQPVTLGIPFVPGHLNDTSGMRVVNDLGQPLIAQFQVTSRWESNEVRWLLVDLLVSIQDGQAPQLFLEFGPDVPGAGEGSGLPATSQASVNANSTGALGFLTAIDPHSLGQFVLQ